MLDKIINIKPWKVTIGCYEISYSKTGQYWIYHKSGEGMEIDEKMLEKMVNDFYTENF